MLGLLDIHQAEFTVTYYSLSVTVITLRNSSPAEISLTLLHSTFILAHTKLADFSVVTILLLLFSLLSCFSVTTLLYYSRTDRTEYTFGSIVETCFQMRCLETVATLR
jgi:hypothetical protein